MLDGYPSLRDVVWLQEEPENMGAWEFVRPLLEELIGDRCAAALHRPRAQLEPVGRIRRVAPAQSDARSSSRRSTLESRAVGRIDGPVEVRFAVSTEALKR